MNPDGSSKIEKGKDNVGKSSSFDRIHSLVRTTGSSQVTFSEKALPSTAKVVVYRNKFRQRNEQVVCEEDPFKE